MNYTDKTIEYFTTPRTDLIGFIPNNKNNKILELGAGGGDTLVAIKNLGKAHEVVGIELMEMQNSNQNHEFIDKMIFGDIEKIDLDLEEQYFDVIVAGDVLEHLIDPWAVVKKISTHLKVGGIFISSIPNIRFGYSKIFLKGDFSYEREGLFDKTHVRFFCKKNMIELFEGNNLDLQLIQPNFKDLPHLSGIKLRNTLTLGLFEEFLALQYFLVHKKH